MTDQPLPQAEPKKERKKMAGWLKWVLINIAVLLIIFITTAIIGLRTKVSFVKPMLIGMGIFFAVEALIFAVYFLATGWKGGKKAASQNKLSLSQIEKEAEDFMWARESIQRSKCENYVSGLRSVKTDSGVSIQAFVWSFKEKVSNYGHYYLFVALANDPETKEYNKLDHKATNEEIIELTKLIATAPLEVKSSKFTRVDPSTGQIVTEEHHEPIYPQAEQPKEAGKL